MNRLAVSFVVALCASAAALAGVSAWRHADGSRAGEPRASERELFVEVSGCAAVRVGSVCERPASGLVRVFVGARVEGPRFVTDTGHAIEVVERARVDGGERFVVRIPEAATVVRLRRDGEADLELFGVDSERAPAWLPEVRALRRAGDVEQARVMLDRAMASGDPVERAFALGLLARLELALGHTEASFSRFREAIALHRAAGRLSDAIDDSLALVFALNQRSYRYEEARSILAALERDVTAYPDGRARHAYYSGTLAMETGDARTALASLRAARLRAERLGLAVLARNATNAESLQLMLLGRTGEAAATLAQLEEHVAAAKDAAPCERVEVAINRGFALLLEKDAREAAGETDALPPIDAAAPLERALSAVNDGCNDVYLRTAALGNLALAAVQRHEPGRARAKLDEARASIEAPRAHEVLFWHHLEGRIALEERDLHGALRAFRREAGLAERMLAFDAEWRARVGMGESLERLGRLDEALAQYLAAEALLTRVGALVPLGEGRGTYLGDRSRSARAAVGLLVRRGRIADAFGVARQSRTRMLATLVQTARRSAFDATERAAWEHALAKYREARAALDAEAKDDWRLARGEAARARERRRAREADLRVALDVSLTASGIDDTRRDAAGARLLVGGARPTAPTSADGLPGAMTLLFHPVRGGWVALVHDAAGFSSAPLESATREGVERLLGGLRERILRASRLRVLAYGELADVDVHALTFESRPLLASLAVEYPLDGASVAVDAERPLAALVVGDPTLDLVSARNEGELVAASLRRDGHVVKVLSGPEATSAAVLEHLGRVRHFHYAGHGVYAGREGWESALPLAGGGRLDVLDIVAAPRVPTTVVLAGCDAARSSSERAALSIGLAQAFLLSGAQSVIAPARAVDDVLAAEMMKALYAEPDRRAEGAPLDPPEALRRAQLRVLAERPQSDWSAFRILVGGACVPCGRW